MCRVDNYSYGANFKNFKSIGLDGDTSAFDPVLTEILYKWNAATKVIDPFAGGSTRGFIAASMGIGYTGIDLSPNQIEADIEQTKHLQPTPEYIVGDSEIMLGEIKDCDYNLGIACPPYYNLEQYSNSERDLSNLSKEEFDSKLQRITKNTLDKICETGRMVFVTGNVRDELGYYCDLRQTVGNIMERLEWRLFNELILVNHVGTKALTAKKCFKGEEVKLWRFIRQSLFMSVAIAPQKNANDNTTVAAKLLHTELERWYKKSKTLWRKSGKR